MIPLLAQTPIDPVDFAPTVHTVPSLWLGLAGALGALGTMYFLLGGIIPGTAGAVDLQRMKADFERFSSDLKREMAKDDADPARLKEMREAVDAARDDYNSSRNKQYLLGTVVFAAVGAGLASFLASGVIEAIGIGAGWTGIFGSFGLRKNAGQVADAKDQAIEALSAELKEMRASRNVPVNPELDRRVAQAKMFTLK